MPDPTADEKASATATPATLVASTTPETGGAVAAQLAHDVNAATYSPWSPRLFRLYLVLSLAYLCGCLNGYDGSLMGGLNGLVSYQRYFNM